MYGFLAFTVAVSTGRVVVSTGRVAPWHGPCVHYTGRVMHYTGRVSITRAVCRLQGSCASGYLLRWLPGSFFVYGFLSVRIAFAIDE